LQITVHTVSPAPHHKLKALIV